MVSDQVFVGTNKPSISMLDPIQNRQSRSKPEGGFWTSPIRESGYSAFEAFDNGALVKDGSKSWLLEPNGRENVLNIQNTTELEELPYIETEKLYNNEKYLDFESIFSMGYDGIKIESNVISAKKYSKNYNLYGWDFESVLWRNLDWIDNITLLGEGGERRENAKW
jgi:hypothetical protein